MLGLRARSTLFPYTTLFRSLDRAQLRERVHGVAGPRQPLAERHGDPARARRPAQHRERLTRARSEEHTSELQSHSELVCRLLLEKKKEATQWWHDPPSPPAR